MDEQASQQGEDKSPQSNGVGGRLRWNEEPEMVLTFIRHYDDLARSAENITGTKKQLKTKAWDLLVARMKRVSIFLRQEKMGELGREGRTTQTIPRPPV